MILIREQEKKKEKREEEVEITIQSVQGRVHLSGITAPHPSRIGPPKLTAGTLRRN
jgi:hypothetical protein